MFGRPFSLVSCTTDSPLVPVETGGKTDMKNENPYYTTKNGDTVLATESLSTTTVTVQEDETVDPDWKKLITHFTGTTGSNE